MTSLKVQDAKRWRDYMKRNLPKNIHVLSPLRGQVSIKKNSTINSEYGDSLFCNQKAITHRDRYDVLKSDVMVVNLIGATRVSIGTMVELGWADSKGIPIVLIMEKDNIHSHPIVKELASFTVPDLDTAIKVVKSILDV